MLAADTKLPFPKECQNGNHVRFGRELGVRNGLLNGVLPTLQ